MEVLYVLYLVLYKELQVDPYRKPCDICPEKQKESTVAQESRGTVLRDSPHHEETRLLEGYKTGEVRSGAYPRRAEERCEHPRIKFMSFAQ
jgi:hypothetical protein